MCKVIKLTCYTIYKDAITTTLEDAIKATPAGKTSLYIYSTVYDALTTEDIQASFRAIRPTINHINIDGLCCDLEGRLRPYRYNEIKEIYSALPSTITSLSFDVRLPRDVNERIAIFSLIPAHVSAIRFGELHVVNDDNIGVLIDVLKNLPRTIKRVYFDGRSLGRYSATGLKRLFQALPEGLLELDLRWCNLDLLNANDLAEAFSGLPNNITMLELSRDEFDDRTSSENQLIFQALPLSVMTSVNSECSSTLNLLLIQSLKTFLDDVKAGHTSEAILMSEIQVQAIHLRQKSLPDDKKNRIRKKLQSLELKKQLLSYINGPVNASYDFLAEWFQSESCAIENKQLLAVWSLYLSLKTQFSGHTDPINLIALAELDFDKPKRFCAFLLWAMNEDEVQNSGILQHFFAYHLSYLGHTDTALHEVYRILNQLSKTPVIKQLLAYANSTHSGVRGAAVNYPLRSEAGLPTWQSSNLAGGNFEHHSELVEGRGELPGLPSPTFPENPDDIVKLYRWFGIDMLKRLDSQRGAHCKAFNSIWMSDEGEALRQALPDFILRGEISLESGVGWLNDIVNAANETQTDMSTLIATNPFYLYTICSASSVIHQLSSDQREQSILALQRKVSESGVNSPSIILWISLYVCLKRSNGYSPIQLMEMNEFILNQMFRFTSSLPDDLYSAVQENLDISEDFMLNKLNQFKQELMASFTIDNFEACSFKWSELRARVYTLLDLCPQLHHNSRYPANIYELKAFYIEEVWRQSRDRFDLKAVLKNMDAFDENQDDINKRMVLEGLLFTQEPALQAILIQHLENHHIDWINEKFGDELFLIEKSILRKNKNLIIHILNCLAGDVPSQEAASATFHHQSKAIVYLVDLYNGGLDIRTAVSSTLLAMIDIGQLNIVKHLVHLSATTKPNRAMVSMALTSAKENQNWNIVKYLFSLTGDNRPHRQAVLDVVECALEEKNWDIATYWLGLTGDNGPTRAEASELLTSMAKIGEAFIIPHLLRLTGDCQLNREHIAEALCQAAITGQLHIVTLFVELTGDSKPNCDDISAALSLAIAGYKREVFTYLLGLTGDNKPTRRAVSNALCCAVAAVDTMDILNQLVHLSGDNKLSLEEVYSSLCLTAQLGQWNIVALLIKFPGVEQFFYNVDDNTLVGVLSHAAAAGQLDILVHLIHLSGENDTTKRNVGYVFCCAAEAGQLDVVHCLLHLTGYNKLRINQIYGACFFCKSETATYLRNFLKTMPVDDFVVAYHENPNTLKCFDLSIAKTLFTASKLPGSAYRYLSDSAKNDPEIILAVYNENPNLLLPGLGRKWMNIFNTIDDMRIYGEYLLEIDAEKGDECIELAANLTAQAFEMVKNKHDTRLLGQSAQTFANILISKNEEMGTYRMKVDTLILNIIIAVISLPVLCLPILIKLLHSYHNEDRFLFFGQSNKTTREEKLECIRANLDAVEQEYGLPGPT